METSALLKAFCTAVEGRDGKGFASLFTEDGVYHDVFYGDFKGREKIAEMIDDWFYRPPLRPRRCFPSSPRTGSNRSAPGCCWPRPWR